METKNSDTSDSSETDPYPIVPVEDTVEDLLKLDPRELISRIKLLREKQLTGNTLTDEELREAVRLLHAVREQRTNKGPGGKSAPKAKAQPLDILADL